MYVLKTTLFLTAIIKIKRKTGTKEGQNTLGQQLLASKHLSFIIKSLSMAK